MGLFEVTHYILSLQGKRIHLEKAPRFLEVLENTSSSFTAHRPVAPITTPAVLPGLTLIALEAFLLVVEPSEHEAERPSCESLMSSSGIMLFQVL